MNIKVLKQSVVFTKADAIVNAANSSLLGGGGVDGAIHAAAGPKLLEECKSLGGCKTGDAKITKAYNIDTAKYIIHTVGPIYAATEDDAKYLANCYSNSLNLAKEKGLSSIAFPCISTGVYGYPIKEAAKIAITSIKAWGENNSSDMDVTICCFTEKEYEVYQKFVCPVCGRYYFSESYEICPICDWENDPVQREDYDYKGGANKYSVNEARKLFLEAQND